jgi:hypothetical protein
MDQPPDLPAEALDAELNRISAIRAAAAEALTRYRSPWVILAESLGAAAPAERRRLRDAWLPGMLSPPYRLAVPATGRALPSPFQARLEAARSPARLGWRLPLRPRPRGRR